MIVKNRLLLTLLLFLGIPHCFGKDINRNFNARLIGLIGNNSLQCGSYFFEKDKKRLLPEIEVNKLKDCMTFAYQQGKSFYFKIEGPNYKSELIDGMLGLPNRGGIYSYTYQSPDCKGELCYDDFSLNRCQGEQLTDTIEPQKTCNWFLAESKHKPQPCDRKSAGCDFKKDLPPQDFSIFYVESQYINEIGYYIDKSGKKANQIDLLVNQKDKPVILMVKAYVPYPTIWNIKIVEGTKVLSVITTGYNRQVVAGTFPDTKVIDKGPSLQEEIELNPFARSMFGKSIDLIYQYKGKQLLIGEEPESKLNIVSYSENTPESYFINPELPDGKAGLDEAIKKEFIRKIQLDELAQLKDRIIETDEQSDLLRKVELMPENIYMVLKPFVVPHKIPEESIFLVPDGVSWPTGNIKQLLIYPLGKIE